MITVPDITRLNSDSARILRENTKITNELDGATGEGVTRTINDRAHELYVAFQAGELSGKLSKAFGVELDEIGQIMGLDRAEMTIAQDLSYQNFRFYFDPAFGSAAQFNNLITNINTHYQPSDRLPTPGGTLTIPGGVWIRSSNNSSAVYKTLDDITLSASNLTAFARVVAQLPGPAANIGAGQLDQWDPAGQEYLMYTTDVIKCGNLQDIISGQQQLSDEEYKYRISKQVDSAACANEIAIRIATLSVPGVSDVIIRKWTHGIGTMSVFPIVSATMVQQGILDAVEAAISAVVSGGNRVYVFGPIYIGLQMTLYVNFKSGTASIDRERYMNEIRSLVVNHINNIQIGGELVLTNVITMAKNVSEGVRDVVISMMRAGELDTSSMVVPNPELLIIANQILRYNEKFYTNASMVETCEM